LARQLVKVSGITRATRSIARYMLRCYGNVAGWLAVTNDKTYLKTFRPSGSHVIWAFWPLAKIPNS